VDENIAAQTRAELYEMKRCFIAAAIAISLCAPQRSVQAATSLQSTPAEGLAQKSFIVYDGTLFKNKPEMAPFGIIEAKILYGADFWPDKKRLDQLPTRENMSRLLARLVASNIPTETPIIIDIEHWHLRGEDGEIQASLEKYASVFDSVKTALPTHMVGFYGLLPMRDYWRAVQPPQSKGYTQWQLENDVLTPLVNRVDALFPSIYTFYSDEDGWDTYARAQIAEAQRIAPGKPIFPFLWFQYHDSNKLLAGTYIGGGYWRRQLATMRGLTNGVVIWGGWSKRGARDWAENMHWWRVVTDMAK
jgi:hypothetical protein